MGTMATIIISMLIGSTCGAFLLAIVQNGSASVKRHAAAVKDYCKEKECQKCKFHKNTYPYCKIGHPIIWDIEATEEEE